MKRRHRKTETASASDWFDATMVDQKPSRLSGVIFLMLCAMLVFSNLAYGSVDTWALAVLTVGAGIIVLLWLADSFLNKEFRFSSDALQLPLLGLILIGLIQLLPLRTSGVPGDLLAVEPVRTLTLNATATRLAVVQLIIDFVFFAAVLAFVSTQKRLRKFVFFIIVFACLMAFFGILQQLVSGDSIYGVSIANAFPFASFVNRHHFAAFMEMTLGLTLSLLYGNATKRDKRLLLIVAVIVMGTAILFTGSRGGMLSLLAVFGFITIVNLMSKRGDENVEEASRFSGLKNKLLPIGGSIALVFALVGMVLFIGGDESLQRGVGFQVKDNDISTGRFHFWQVTLRIIAANPIIGAGLDAFATSFPRYDTWNGTLRVEQAHNDYLQILADAGILGFICVAVFVFLLYKRGWRIITHTSDRFRRGVAAGALAGCFGVLVHSLFDFPLRTPANALFFLALAALAATSINYPKLYKR